MRVWLHLVAVAAVVLAGCASSSSPGALAHLAMKEGSRSAAKGFWQEALFRFQQAAEVSPDDAEIINNVAVAEEALGRYEAALASYKHALQLAAGNTTIKRNYARFAEFYTSYARGARIKKDDDAKP